jgi:hypothetical protein
MQAWTHRLVIPLTALLAILPLLLFGLSYGHDFHFHLTSWMEANAQFAHFQYPRWAYTPANDAGEPRFLFYPPLSWSLGGLLGFFMPWRFVPVAFDFTALTLCGFTVHRLLSRFASPGAALFGALLYVVNPYMLFTAYERCADGELLAAAWIPLLFLAALQPRVRIVPIACAIALLWLTNAPAAVIGCYSLALLTLLRLMAPPAAVDDQPSLAARQAHMRVRWPVALNTLAGTALGLGLAAFYLIPAAFERRYIQSEMALVPGMRIIDNTLFHNSYPNDDYAEHDAVLRRASLVAIALLAAILISGLAIWRDRRKKHVANPSLLTPLAVLTVIITFLLTPPALFLWRYTPELRYLQFPWRFCIILAAILSLLLAVALDGGTPTSARFSGSPFQRKSRVRTAAAGGLIVLLIAFCWRTFNAGTDPDELVSVRLAQWKQHIGGDATDEYTPVTADNDALKKSNPPFWLVPVQAAAPGDAVNTPSPANAAPGPAPDHLTLTLTRPEFLILDRREYPDWRISLNGAALAPYSPIRDDGLITLQLPAGADRIDLVFRSTFDQILGLLVSLIAVILLLLLRRLPAEQPDASPLLDPTLNPR